jgi:transposase
MDDEPGARKPYPSDVSDEEWAFAAPYLALMRSDAPQRHHDLREIFNALRWMVRSGSPWRYLPTNFPPWEAVYQQTRRWIDAGVFAAMTHDLRELLRWSDGRDPDPSAVIFDSTTRQSTPESGTRAGYDGYKRRKGSKVHIAVDTLGHLLALHVTPANAQDREQVATLCAAVQEATGQTVEVAYVDQGYTGPAARAAAAQHGIDLMVVKLNQAKRGFVLLPRRWVVERSFAWATRFRRLAKDYERLPDVVEGLYFLAFVGLMLKHLLLVATQSP